MVPWPDAPLLSTGSLGSVPRLPRYYEGTPTPHGPSRLASLPSLSGTAVAPLCSLPREVVRLTPVGLDLVSPLARPAPYRGEHGASQVPGWTLCAPAIAPQTPGESPRKTIAALRCCLRPVNGVRLPRTMTFEAQSRGRRARCLRFVGRVASPVPRKTRYRRVVAFAGQDSHLLAHTRRFQ